MRRFCFVLALIAGLALLWPALARAQGQESTDGIALVGTVADSQGQPIVNATVAAIAHDGTVLGQTKTQPDGSFTLPVGSDGLLLAELELSRTHFVTTREALAPDVPARLADGQTVLLPGMVMDRQITPAFWVATLVFLAMLALIAFGRLHNTLAALLGASLVLGASYLGGPMLPGLYVFDFTTALRYVDWNVIFLIMGMMIVIAVVERTGVFQWSAYMAYRLSGGRTWLLLTILMLITGLASAFLDNVTTMLLMTPITIQIALSLGINPLALLIPEVMASNIVGISTLVGTPTNILIGSFGRISFTDFLSNLTPGVVLSLIGLILYSQFIYRQELNAAGNSGISTMLLERLAERGRITQPEHLRKAGVVGGAMILLFVFGERFHLLPSVTAILGATALLVWIKPDIEEMIEAVDWTTLVFFISLFICVGAVQEVGLISIIAEAIGRLVGANLTLAMIAIIWFSALLSTVIANIPFTAAMLPVIGFLTGTVPGAESKALYYCLSVGSAMGGNGSLIGASANMVTAGIAERAGSTITYGYFLKKGLPALFLTVGLATGWLLLHFL